MHATWQKISKGLKPAQIFWISQPHLASGSDVSTGSVSKTCKLDVSSPAAPGAFPAYTGSYRCIDMLMSASFEDRFWKAVPLMLQSLCSDKNSGFTVLCSLWSRCFACKKASSYSHGCQTFELQRSTSARAAPECWNPKPHGTVALWKLHQTVMKSETN